MRVLKFVMSLNVPSLRRRSAKYLVEFFGCFFRHSRLRFAFLPGLFKCHRRLHSRTFSELAFCQARAFALLFSTFFRYQRRHAIAAFPGLRARVARALAAAMPGCFRLHSRGPLRFVSIELLAVLLPPLALIDSVLFSRTHCGIRRRAGLHG